jgi:DNA (cytosine-5)-methyltransferase 1
VTALASDYEFTDVFCGAGGSSSGLAAAGLKLRTAANHWKRAIETHSANFPDAEHLCVDVDHYDMRRMPSTHVLWASPICTELSPSGGRKKKRQAVPKGQLILSAEEFGPIESAAYERTRATFWDVIRATEVHRYPIVIIENVVEAYSWELFDVWLSAMDKLGYHHQLISVSAAHIGDDQGNDPAPQWRDRLYVFFTRTDLKPPKIEPRPKAFCFPCGEIVHAVQSWKRLDRPKVGKYGLQYVYRCPNIACKHSIVEPYVLPAASAIDWTDIGNRIGDKPLKDFKDKTTGETVHSPLAPATMRRIRIGLEMFASPIDVAVHGQTFERDGYTRAWPVESSPLTGRNASGGDGLACPPYMFATNHGDSGDARAFLPDAQPLPKRQTKVGEGIVCPPFVMKHYTPRGREGQMVDSPETDPLGAVTTYLNQSVVQPFIGELRNHDTPRPADEAPTMTISAGGNHAYLGIPGAFIQKHHGSVEYGPIEHMLKSPGEPLSTVPSRVNMSLVIPYRKGRAKPASDPLLTVATRTSAGIANVIDQATIDDCYFRMLKPREHGRAQRFRDSYVVLGHGGEQTMQFGNAVASNVAQWLGGYAVLTLEGAA